MRTSASNFFLLHLRARQLSNDRLPTRTYGMAWHGMWMDSSSHCVYVLYDDDDDDDDDGSGGGCATGQVKREKERDDGTYAEKKAKDFEPETRNGEEDDDDDEARHKTCLLMLLAKKPERRFACKNAAV